MIRPLLGDTFIIAYLQKNATDLKFTNAGRRFCSSDLGDIVRWRRLLRLLNSPITRLLNFQSLFQISRLLRFAHELTLTTSSSRTPVNEPAHSSAGEPGPRRALRAQ